MPFFVFAPVSSRSTTPTLLRPTLSVAIASVCFAGLLVTAGNAAAIPISITSSFVETRGKPGTPDTFTITNSFASGLGISELRIDLSGSSGVVFDPSGAAFGVTSSDDVGFDEIGIGFELTGNDVLRLSFASFDPGETFSFGVDVDDISGSTRGLEFQGASLTVILDDNSTVLQGIYAADSESNYLAAVSIEQGLVANPEPSSALLMAAGLVMLHAQSRKWRRRSLCTP